MHETITKGMLAGLKFNTTRKGKKTGDDGSEVDAVFPIQVDMKPEHILSAKEYPDGIVLVSKDGRKHKIAKPEKKEEKKEEKKTA